VFRVVYFGYSLETGSIFGCFGSFVSSLVAKCNACSGTSGRLFRVYPRNIMRVRVHRVDYFGSSPEIQCVFWSRRRVEVVFGYIGSSVSGLVVKWEMISGLLFLIVSGIVAKWYMFSGTSRRLFRV
jgi:hypothetical protein